MQARHSLNKKWEKFGAGLEKECLIFKIKIYRFSGFRIKEVLVLITVPMSLRKMLSLSNSFYRNTKLLMYYGTPGFGKIKKMNLF